MKPLFCSDPLQRFACDGLRTLVLGTKDLSEGEYESWKRSHAEAANCIEDREERLDAVYDQIEKGLDLLGATAIEDKLQVSSKTKLTDTFIRLLRNTFYVFPPFLYAVQLTNSIFAPLLCIKCKVNVFH